MNWAALPGPRRFAIIPAAWSCWLRSWSSAAGQAQPCGARWWLSGWRCWPRPRAPGVPATSPGAGTAGQPPLARGGDSVERPRDVVAVEGVRVRLHQAIPSWHGWRGPRRDRRERRPNRGHRHRGWPRRGLLRLDALRLLLERLGWGRPERGHLLDVPHLRALVIRVATRFRINLAHGELQHLDVLRGHPLRQQLQLVLERPALLNLPEAPSALVPATRARSPARAASGRRRGGRSRPVLVQVLGQPGLDGLLSSVRHLSPPVRRRASTRRRQRWRSARPRPAVHRRRR